MIPPHLEMHPAAVAEAQRAFRWYRRHSSTAAKRFQLALEAALDVVATSPERGTPYIHNTRYRLLRRFPYLVTYREVGDRVQVIAIAHARQRPGYWRKRVQ